MFRDVPFDETNIEHTVLMEEAALLHWGIKGEVECRSQIPEEIDEDELTLQVSLRLGGRDIG